MTVSGGRTALVFGASGISGWAIIREALAHPTPDTFESVIGLTNRPLNRSEALLPADSRLQLQSGIDLTKDPELVSQSLGKIACIQNVTNVYFTAYTGHGSDYQELKRANVQLLRNAVSVVEKSCPKVKLWTLQTGGKWYGVEFPGQIEFSVPFKESSPRIPSPYAEDIFYYAQHDLLEDLSKGKPWTFTEIRPDAIIGFVPNNNAMNLAQCLGLFLALYRSVEGQDATVPYPGGDKEYESVHSDTSQDILARFTIFASMHPDKTSRRAFNVADGADVTWQSVWRGICEYFDLKGVGPDPSRTTGAKWVMDHENKWTEWYQQHDLKRGTLEGTTWDFMEAIFGINFNRQYDLSAARNIGFTEEVDTIAGYYKAFDRMKEAKLIPRSFT